MDWAGIATGIAVVGFVYGFLRNFKQDIDRDFENLKKSIDRDFENINRKMDLHEHRVDLQEERIFLLATGKTLQEAMLQAKMNQDNKKNKT